MAVTPFPRPSSVKIREKARQMLNEYGKKMREKEEAAAAAAAKPPTPMTTPKPSPSLRKPTRVSSDTRFPGARSPATRERARKILKEMVAQKVKKTSKEKEKGQKVSSDSCTSLRTIYSKSYVRYGSHCEKCTLCPDCAADCVKKHLDKKALSESESKKFLAEVNRLREQFGQKNTDKTTCSPQFEPKVKEIPELPKESTGKTK